MKYKILRYCPLIEDQNIIYDNDYIVIAPEDTLNIFKYMEINGYLTLTDGNSIYESIAVDEYIDR